MARELKHKVRHRFTKKIGNIFGVRERGKEERADVRWSLCKSMVLFYDVYSRGFFYYVNKRTDGTKIRGEPS